jgi:hypothetical protein
MREEIHPESERAKSEMEEVVEMFHFIYEIIYFMPVVEKKIENNYNL